MRYAKWTAIALIAAVVAAFLDYTLPSHQVVRIVGATTQRIDLGANAWFYAAPDAGTARAAGRDVKFIQTILPDGAPLVFRNEDTGWGWPPYLKFNSFNLQTEASNLVSNADKPKWVMVTYYGWRMQLLTIFPNAVAMRPVAGPDASVFPWFNTIFLILLAVAAFLVWRSWRRFRRRRIDPVIDEMGDAWDRAEAETGDLRARGAAFWRRLRGLMR